MNHTKVLLKNTIIIQMLFTILLFACNKNTSAQIVQLDPTFNFVDQGLEEQVLNIAVNKMGNYW